MYWIYLAIVALVLFGISRTLYIIASRAKNIPEWIFLISLNSTAIVVALIMLLALSIDKLYIDSIIIGTVLGLLSTAGAISLYRANATCSPSLVNIILGMNFILPLLVGIVFLEEKLSLYQSIGLILVVSTIVISAVEGVKYSNRKFKLSGISYALITFFTWGSLGIIIKISKMLNILHNFITCLLFMYIIETSILLVVYRRDIRHIKHTEILVPGTLAGIFSCVGSYMAIICYAIGEISITSLILRFSFIIPTFFSFLYYREFNILKIFLTILSIISVVLLSM